MNEKIIDDSEDPSTTNTKPKIKLSSLSAVECFGLTVAQAVMVMVKPIGQRTLWENNLLQEFAAGLKKARETMSEGELNRKKQEGLRALADKGLVELARDGQGEYVPIAIHEERLDRRRDLVTGEWQ